MTVSAEPGRWYTYHFETRLRCAIPDAYSHQHKLYIGKSNLPWRRLLEHAKTQGWFPHHSGYQIHEKTYATEAEALAAEKAMILAELPLANKQHNERNAHRIDFDALVPRQPRAARREPSPRPVRRRRWTRSQQRLAGVAAAWLALAAAGWWASAHYLDLGVQPGALTGAGSSSTLLALFGLAQLPKRRRRALLTTISVAVAALTIGWVYLKGSTP